MVEDRVCARVEECPGGISSKCRAGWVYEHVELGSGNFRDFVGTRNLLMGLQHLLKLSTVMSGSEVWTAWGFRRHLVLESLVSRVAQWLADCNLSTAFDSRLVKR